MPEYLDADGHAVEPRDLYASNVSPRHRDRAIQVVWNDDLDSEMLVGEGRVILDRGVAAAGLAERPWTDFARGVRYDAEHLAPGGFDPQARMVDMERHGIDVSVLFPTLGLTVSELADPALALDHCRIANDWLADYCSGQPGRLYGVGIVPLQDVGLAVPEARRCVERLGLRGVMVRPNPFDGRHLHHPDFDRLWSVVQELDVPVCLHPGGARNTWSFQSAAGQYPVAPALGYGYALAAMVDAQLTWTLLVGGGVLDRFPRLRVGIMETGGGWMAQWLVRMDHVNEVYGWAEPRLALRPSEYFRRQGWISFDPDEATLPATADIIGPERILWASDYPHQDLRSHCVRSDLDATIAGLAPGAQDAVRSTNARGFYAIP